MSKLVTYEQAEKLRKLGFNNPTSIIYIAVGGKTKSPINNWYINSEFSYKYCSAPTVSEALDFIREEKKIECGAYPSIQSIDSRSNKILNYHYRAYDLTTPNWSRIHIKIKKFIATQNQADSLLLNAVLEYLEKGGNHV